MKPRKPWLYRDGIDARCDRCGGRSRWVVGTRLRLFWDSIKGTSGYWRWWQGFKRRHGRCVAK